MFVTCYQDTPLVSVQLLKSFTPSLVRFTHASAYVWREGVRTRERERYDSRYSYVEERR